MPGLVVPLRDIVDDGVGGRRHRQGVEQHRREHRHQVDGDHRGGNDASRSVSRILSPPHGRGTAIHLGCRLPGTSCGLTRDLGRAAPGCGGPRPSLFDLAPGGVYLAGRSPGRRWALTPPFHRCRDRDRGCVISVALSFGSPRLGVTQRPALWSPDFPQAASRPRPSDRLAVRVYARSADPESRVPPPSGIGSGRPWIAPATAPAAPLSPAIPSAASSTFLGLGTPGPPGGGGASVPFDRRTSVLIDALTTPVYASRPWWCEVVRSGESDDEVPDRARLQRRAGDGG